MKKLSRTGEFFMNMYATMRGAFGHRNWWPGDTPFEVCVGAVLTQNTSWKNVAKAIANLANHGALDPFTLCKMPLDELAELIRPSGYYNVKARRLRNFIVLLVEKYGGDLDALFSLPVTDLREELLSVRGIGKETADSIILYAAHKPIFVVDAYTKRVLVRHGLVDEDADYDAMQELFHFHLPPDVALYNDFHAQFVAVGHHYCKKEPRCRQCPLGIYHSEAALRRLAGES
ncbi:MAG: endonuclease III domain-containing protein [Desulfomonile sp.]|nr:endonuclease III domain-containing protein [Desulfomonile sp.]